MPEQKTNSIRVHLVSSLQERPLAQMLTASPGLLRRDYLQEDTLVIPVLSLTHFREEIVWGSSTRLDQHLVGIEGAPAIEVGQSVRCGPVDVAPIWTELWPPDRRCRQDAGTHVLCHLRYQATPAAFVAHTHQLPAANITRFGIEGVNL